MELQQNEILSIWCAVHSMFQEFCAIIKNLRILVAPHTHYMGSFEKKIVNKD